MGFVFRWTLLIEAFMGMMISLTRGAESPGPTKGGPKEPAACRLKCKSCFIGRKNEVVLGHDEEWPDIGPLTY